MRNKLFILAIGGILALGASSVPAQDSSTQQPQGQWARGHHRMDPDQQLAHMTRALDLTSGQQSQIRPILLDRQQKTQALWQNQSLSREDRRSQMLAIQQDTQSRIEGVLNDQQKQKYEAMQQRMREHRRGMMGGGNQPPAGTPEPQ